jgi:hypothetical protein
MRLLELSLGDVAAIAGVALLVAGLWLAWPPAALVVLGLALITYGVGAAK